MIEKFLDNLILDNIDNKYNSNILVEKLVNFLVNIMR